MQHAPSAPSAPARSLEQRMAALGEANRIRTYRATIKRDMKRKTVHVSDLLLGDDPDLATMKVFDLLLAVPKVGRVKVNKTLRRAVISPSKTVGGLSERQRRELAVAMQAYPSMSRGTIQR